MIIADFSSGDAVVRTEGLFQWDLGQQLKIIGLSEVTNVSQVHFANNRMRQAIVKRGTYENGALTVDIPNEFLQYGGPIPGRAWVYIYRSDTVGYTVKTVHIPIIERSRPNDYVSPTDPDSQGIVKAAMQLLENYQTDLDGKLDDAVGSVENENIHDGAVTEEKLSFQAREKLNSIDSESVREATAQYLAAHPDLSASLRFVTPEMFTEGTDAEKITAAIDSGLPVLLTGTYNVGDFTISSPCRIFGRKPDNSKNVYNLIGNITFTMPAVLSDLTIKGSVTFDKVTDETVSTQMSSTIVTNVSVRGNDADAYPTHNGFVIRSSEGRFTNCVASNALHGFSVENIANRLVNCTSYFNMLDGFHVNQGTNMLLACKAFLNSRYNKYWLTHGGYDRGSNPPRANYYGYYLGRKDIQCVGCSSQQNHRGSVYIGTDALVTDINIMGDNTDYYDQDTDIRNDSKDSAAFTFGPGVQDAILAPRISGKVSLYRDGGDWSAYTPIVFKKLGSKSNIYIDANIFVPELVPDFNSEVSPTVLGSGMEGIENIVINGNALFNSLHGFSISSQSTNALYSYDDNVLRTSNKNLSRSFTSTDFMSCKQVTVAVDFRSDLESSYCNVGVMLSDDTVMPGIYQKNTNQYSDVHTFIAPEGKTITGISIQGASHPDTDNWNEFWDYYRIKVSFET